MTTIKPYHAAVRVRALGFKTHLDHPLADPVVVVLPHQLHERTTHSRRAACSPRVAFTGAFPTSANPQQSLQYSRRQQAARELGSDDAACPQWAGPAGAAQEPL